MSAETIMIPIEAKPTLAELQRYSPDEFERIKDAEHVGALEHYDDLRKRGYTAESAAIVQTEAGTFLHVVMYREHETAESPAPTSASDLYHFDKLMKIARVRLDDLDDSIAKGIAHHARRTHAGLYGVITFLSELSQGQHNFTLAQFAAEVEARKSAVDALFTIPPYNTTPPYTNNDIAIVLNQLLSNVDAAIESGNRQFALNLANGFSSVYTFVALLVHDNWKSRLPLYLKYLDDRYKQIGAMPADPVVPTYTNDDFTATLKEHLHILDHAIADGNRGIAYHLADNLQNQLTFVANLTGGNWQVGQSGFMGELQERYEQIAKLPTPNTDVDAPVAYSQMAARIRHYISMANSAIRSGDTLNASNFIDLLGGMWMLIDDMYHFPVAEKNALAREIQNARTNYSNAN